ncbi:protein LST8 homolog [Drosophila serrata]|uniref:protein LST8 homolog n=1 Tax=Drosophila serrata TaxID=7274 RepID=UPI000A1D0510|nr:protein LST8 homolog [Drosophila serrata]
MGDQQQQQLILATGGYDHTIKVWQAHTGNCIKTMRFVEASVRQVLGLFPGSPCQV